MELLDLDELIFQFWFSYVVNIFQSACFPRKYGKRKEIIVLIDGFFHCFTWDPSLMEQFSLAWAKFSVLVFLYFPDFPQLSKYVDSCITGKNCTPWGL